MEHYLDNSATTKVSETAAKKVYEMMTENYGNPSSLHTRGIKAEDELISARSSIAKALGVTSAEIYFTSGGTEANNLAVFGTVNRLKKRGNKIVTTAFEHSSVYESVKHLEENGFQTVYVKPDENGHFSIEDFENAIDKNTILVSVMAVNNELGTILPIERLKKIIEKKQSPALLHCDCVQAFGKIPLKLSKIGVDLASVSGHKVHAPKGTGALFVRKNLHIKPLLFGGEQEKKLRPGTEALPLITGFSQAVKEFDIIKNYNYINELNAYAKERLLELDDIVINSPEDALPYIINFSALGIRSETMLHFLAQKEIYVSSGSACAKGKPSHVLSAAGLSRERADSALRVSFCELNTKEDIDALISALKEGINTLARRKG
ncbi:MAG: cysteine desulfurase [Ruminococcus sp.]|nr:cysteine desulfurase [Ruminococcus sp.]